MKIQKDPKFHEIHNLNELREHIDEIDEAIVELLNERVEVSIEVGKLKNNTHKPVLDSSREKQVIGHVEELSDHPSLKQRIPEVYKIIMEVSKDVQKEIP